MSGKRGTTGVKFKQETKASQSVGAASCNQAPANIAARSVLPGCHPNARPPTSWAALLSSRTSHNSSSSLPCDANTSTKQSTNVNLMNNSTIPHTTVIHASPPTESTPPFISSNLPVTLASTTSTSPNLPATTSTAAATPRSWASFLGGSAIVKSISGSEGGDGSRGTSDRSGNPPPATTTTTTTNAATCRTTAPTVSSTSPSTSSGSANSSQPGSKIGTKLKVEVTFRPDRELKQPAGCEWLERRAIIIDLAWDWMYLKTVLEDTVRRHLSERERHAWAQLPTASRPESRAEQIRVWGIRAVGVDIDMGDGRKDVQLYDREQKWKVDMSWDRFLQKLPSHKRVNHNEKPAWTLYLAYDMGISLHRDLRGKPKALLS